MGPRKSSSNCISIGSAVFAVNGDRLECLIQRNGGHIEHNLEQFKCYLVHLS